MRKPLAGRRLCRREQAQAGQGFLGSALDEAGLAQCGDQRRPGEAAVEAAERTPQADRDQVARIAAQAQRAGDCRRALVGFHEYQAPAWLQHPPDLGENNASVRDEVQETVPGTAVQARIAKGQPSRVGLQPADPCARQVGLAAAPARFAKHARRDIHADERRSRQSARQLKGRHARPAAQIGDQRRGAETVQPLR